MERRDIKEFEGKYVKLFLSSGFCYSGKIIEVKSSKIIFMDKFGKTIVILTAAIHAIQNINDEVGKFFEK